MKEMQWHLLARDNEECRNPSPVVHVHRLFDDEVPHLLKEQFSWSIPVNIRPTSCYLMRPVEESQMDDILKELWEANIVTNHLDYVKGRLKGLKKHLHIRLN